MVSIHRPLGYGPSTLPLRHSASHTTTTNKDTATDRYYSIQNKIAEDGFDPSTSGSTLPLRHWIPTILYNSQLECYCVTSLSTTTANTTDTC